MKKALIIAVLVAAAVLALRGCFGGSTTSWNHRLTLVVETPSGDVTGSSVIEARVAYYSGGQMMSGTQVHYDLTGDLILMLVSFEDLTKAETVREVGPENLSAVFGEGVRLEAMTLETTRDAVTEGRVEGVLVWMPDYPEAPIIPIVDPMDFSLSATLRQGDFVRRDGAL